MKACLSCGIDISYRAIHTQRCVVCAAVRRKKLRKIYVCKYNQSSKGQAYQKQWRAKNKEHLRAYNIIYRPVRNAQQRANRPQAREYEARRRKEYPEKHRAKKALRRAAKKNATPTWVDRVALAAIYKRAAKEGKHVDHIVPLQHSQVCGLHVPWNLQLLTPEENHRKRNKFRV